MAKKYTEDDVPEEIKAKFGYLKAKPSALKPENSQKLQNAPNVLKDQSLLKSTPQQPPLALQFKPPIQGEFKAPFEFGPMPKDAIKYTNDDVPEHIKKRFPQFNIKQEQKPEQLKDDGETVQQVPKYTNSQPIPIKGQFLQSPSLQLQQLFSRPPQFQKFGTPLSYSNVFVPPQIQLKATQQNAPQVQKKASQQNAEKNE